MVADEKIEKTIFTKKQDLKKLLVNL